MDRNRLEYAIVKYGTPLYVFDLDMLEEETERIRRGVGPDLSQSFSGREDGGTGRETGNLFHGRVQDL